MLKSKCPSCGGTERHTHDCISLYANDCPICPYCGRVETAPWEIMAIEDEATAAFECGGCEQEYAIVVSISVKYTTKATGGSDD